MRCEIVAVGTELLLGQIVDTNSTWLAERLATLGIDCYFQTKVGDNLARIEETLRLALSRADVVIVCGGLGPTQDDITRQAIANVMGVPLQRDPALLARIEAIFHQRGHSFADNNALQADVPVGARPMATIAGTAPGLICPVGEKRIYAMPGVPREMREMFDADLLPDLLRRRGDATTIVSHTLYCLGLGESVIAERLAPRLQALDTALGTTGNPTIAFLASDFSGVRVRLTAKAADAKEAQQILEKEAHEIRALLGDAVFSEGCNDNDPTHHLPEAVVLRLLAERGKTLAVAESLTGGGIGARLTSVAGSSHVFRGGIVAYASDVKFEMLSVPRGAVISEEAAAHMARNVRQRLCADVGLAATGVAGPDAQEDLPPGTVCVAVAWGDDITTRTLNLSGRPREQVRILTATWLFDMLRRKILGLSN
ncbi:MAG: competence/damage-inducible protein A [Proteobacteria bacterium]|nr:competence/damage-inducible protein A [Pseudomonadota bacterium]MCL2306676.1 competence/damage-inducible protein A [Pseudomonadota bacterium]